MTKTTRFVALDSTGQSISTHDERDAAAAACQDAAAEAGDDGEEYEVVETGSVEIVVAGPELGDVSEAEYETECDRLESCYSQIEGDTQYCVSVRRCWSGEAPGTYIRRANGQLQILGYSVERPEDLTDLSTEAWELFGK
jgi:hypothetical protein